MAIRMVREPSEVPNISNLDDFVGLRYTYGDQNGYCVGKGSEVGYSISGSTFKVLGGRIVIQGVECDIDANGVELIIDNMSVKRYHTVYAQVSLSTMTATVLETYDTAGFPRIDLGDDLTENTIGTARVALYQFTSTSGVISEVTKVIDPIQYAYQQVEALKTGLLEGSVKPKQSVNSTYAQYASTDLSKGTIEARLTNLGFKSGSSSIYNGTATLTRQGNYVIAKLYINTGRYYETSSPLYKGGTLGTLPVNFRPKNPVTMTIGGLATFNSNVRVSYTATLTIYTSGVMSISQPECMYPFFTASSNSETTTSCRIITLNIQIGFEAPAIT